MMPQRVQTMRGPNVRLPLHRRDREPRSIGRADPAGHGKFARGGEIVSRAATIGHLQQDVFIGRSSVNWKPADVAGQTLERRPLSAFRICAIQRSSFSRSIQAFRRRKSPPRRSRSGPVEGEDRSPIYLCAALGNVIEVTSKIRSFHAVSAVISSTSRTIARRSFASSIHMNAFTKAKPSDVARKSVT